MERIVNRHFSPSLHLAFPKHLRSPLSGFRHSGSCVQRLQVAVEQSPCRSNSSFSSCEYFSSMELVVLPQWDCFKSYQYKRESKPTRQSLPALECITLDHDHDIGWLLRNLHDIPTTWWSAIANYIDFHRTGCLSVDLVGGNWISSPVTMRHKPACKEPEDTHTSQRFDISQAGGWKKLSNSGGPSLRCTQ